MAGLDHQEQMKIALQLQREHGRGSQPRGRGRGRAGAGAAGITRGSRLNAPTGSGVTRFQPFQGSCLAFVNTLDAASPFIKLTSPSASVPSPLTPVRTPARTQDTGFRTPDPSLHSPESMEVDTPVSNHRPFQPVIQYYNDNPQPQNQENTRPERVSGQGQPATVPRLAASQSALPQPRSNGSHAPMEAAFQQSQPIISFYSDTQQPQQSQGSMTPLQPISHDVSMNSFTSQGPRAQGNSDVMTARQLNEEGKPVIWNYSTDSPPRVYQSQIQSDPSPEQPARISTRRPDFGRTPGVDLLELLDDAGSSTNLGPGSTIHYLSENSHPFNSNNGSLAATAGGICTCTGPRQDRGLMTSRHAAGADSLVRMPQRFTDPCPIHGNDHIFGQGNDFYGRTA